MLARYPGGRLGYRFGHREMTVVSLLWAAVMTAVSGLAVSASMLAAVLVLFVVAEKLRWPT